MQTPAERGMGEAQTRNDSDRELISRFLSARDESAFAQIVSRYSRLVMSVAMHTLRDPHAAEDAFQATFLVLAKSARRIRNRDSLASWLHGTTFRVSQRLLRTRLRRKEQDLPSVELPSPIWATPAPPDQQVALDEELARLSEGLRAPLVLHYLEGRTVPEIARELKMSQSAVEGRLKRGKQTLRKRLLKRGVLLSSALHAGSLLIPAEAHVTATLLQATVAACLAATASTTLAPIAASTVTQLALQEMASMTRIALMKMALLWAGVAGVVGLAGAGANGRLGTAWAGSQVVTPAAGSPTAVVGSDQTDLAPRTLNTTVAQASAVVPAGSVTAGETPATPTAARRAVETALEKRTNMLMVGQTLPEIAEYLSRENKMSIIIDPQVYSETKVTPQTEVKLEATNVPLKAALEELLKDIDGGPLKYRVEDDGLHILSALIPVAKKNREDAVGGGDPRLPASAGERAQAALLRDESSSATSQALGEMLRYWSQSGNFPVVIDEPVAEISDRLKKEVSFQATGIKLHTVLTSLLDDAGLTYRIEDDGLHIGSKPTMRTRLEDGLKNEVSFNFEAAPLPKIIEFVEKRLGGPVRGDDAFKAAVEARTLINSKILGAQPLREALQTLLAEVPGGPFSLRVDDDGLFIAAKPKSASPSGVSDPTAPASGDPAAPAAGGFGGLPGAEGGIGGATGGVADAGFDASSVAPSRTGSSSPFGGTRGGFSPFGGARGGSSPFGEARGGVPGAPSAGGLGGAPGQPGTADMSAMPLQGRPLGGGPAPTAGMPGAPGFGGGFGGMGIGTAGTAPGRSKPKTKGPAGSGTGVGTASASQTVQAIHAANPREEQIRKTLENPIDFQFSGQALQEVMTYLASENNISIRLDTNSLSEAGVGPETQVNLVISGAIFREALNLMFEDVGGTKLDYVIEDGVMKVMTRDKADTIMQTVLYDVSAMEIDAAEISEILQKTASPASWEINGGEGTITPLERSLIVTTSRRVHEKTAKLLEMLQRQAKATSVTDR